MTTVYKYRVFCATDAKFEYVWGETEPTTCPTNSSHTINSTKTSIVDTCESNVVTVREESTATGGRFGCTTLKVSAAANSAGTVFYSYPYAISALVITFISAESHRGNFLDLAISKDTITGILTSNISSASAWTSQNYVVGQKVTYTDSIGERVYTCVLNTVSNEVPTNKTYWILGFELSVSPTVVQNTLTGYYIKLTNGSTIDNMGRVIYKNSTTNKIYVENNTTNSYSAGSPTYVKQTIYVLKDYEFAESWEHDIGQSKIGGAYIPADTKITIDYINNTGVDSSLVGRVEYLY